MTLAHLIAVLHYCKSLLRRLLTSRFFLKALDKLRSYYSQEHFPKLAATFAVLMFLILLKKFINGLA